MSGSVVGGEGSPEQVDEPVQVAGGQAEAARGLGRSTAVSFACSVSGQAAGHSRHAGGAAPGNSAIDAVKVCR
jgi:hypothetical protein